MDKRIVGSVVALIMIVYLFSCSHVDNKNITAEVTQTIETGPMILSPVETIYQFPIFRFMPPPSSADTTRVALPFKHPPMLLKPMYLIENDPNDDIVTIPFPYAIALVDSIHTVPIHRLIPLPSNADSVFVPIPYDPTKYPPKPIFNMQAIYVTASRAASVGFDAFLDLAKDAGLTAIVFDAKEMQGHVHFSIKDHPELIYTVSDNVLDIDQTVKKIHDKGLYAIARIVQFYNRETARRHPELRPLNRNGGYWNEREGAPTWLDSSHPDVQEELLRIIEIVAKSNVDEIQLDYIRFPTEGAINSASFYFEREDIELLKANPNYVKREKRDVIRDYLKRVRAICDKHNVKLSADVFAIVAWQRAVDIRSTGQDIKYMSPYLDKIHPMIYSSHFSDDFGFEKPDFRNHPYHIVKTGIEKTIAAADPKCEVMPYLQAFSWRVNYTRNYMFQQLDATKDSGAKGFLLWNTSANYTNGIGWVKEWNALQKQ